MSHHLTVSILHKGFQKRFTAHLMKLMANYADPVSLHCPLNSRGSSFEFIETRNAMQFIRKPANSVVASQLAVEG